MTKRLLAVLLALVMIAGMLPVLALADGEAAAPPKAIANGEELSVFETVDGYEYYDWMAGASVKTNLYTVSIPLVAIDKITIDFGGNTFIVYAYDANGEYVAAYGDTAGQTSIDTGDYDYYYWVQTPYAEDYSSGGDMQYVVNFKPQFQANVAGTETQLWDVSTEKNGYKYSFSYLGEATEYLVDLYTIRIPYGVEEVDFAFAANCLAYNYFGTGEGPVIVDGDDTTSWLDGYYEDFMNGDVYATRKVDANADGAADYIQIQAPYDENWNSPVLYAITFEYIFGASVDGEPMTQVSAEVGAYPTFTYDENWNPVPGDPVTLYTVALPEGTEKVDLTFPESVLAYNYKPDGMTYIAGDFDTTVGVTELTVDVDADGDGEPDCIQVQNLYNADWTGGEVIYAITFDVGGLTAGEGAEITADELRDNIAAKYALSGVADDANAPWLAADMMAYQALFPDTTFILNDEQKQAMVDKAVAAIDAAASPSDAAKNIIALAAMNFDPRQLTTAQGVELDAVAKLDELTFAEGGALTDGAASVYAMPYILIAYTQFNDCEEKCLALVAAAVENKAGWLDTTWGVDAITPMMLALAPWYSEADVKAAVDEGVEALKAAQVENGAIGGYTGSADACSTGLAMAGLAAIGVDPSTFVNEAGKSLLDGIVTLAGEDKASLNPTSSSYATEQGFRGLVAAAGAQDRSYKIYDFGGSIADRIPAVASAEKVSFTDVPEDHWAAEQIADLASRGIIKGYGDGTFGVDDNIARRDFVVILYRLAGEPDGEFDAAFSDVPANEYYSDAIAWAASKGIVNGVGGGLFQPTANVTREQLATMLFRYANVMGIAIPEGEAKTFTDADQISDFAAEAVAAMSAAGIINGTPEGAFLPGGDATRAQTAKMVSVLDSYK
ncbi:MAG: S-layer homology domain-containing protein [Oscillospiraceae bacterium]|nr:S-layer homology domain-containing protein [Oscillospiraceae bacterium]